MAVPTPVLGIARHAVPVSEDDSLDSVTEIESCEDASDVGLDGRFGDEQFGRDFGVGHPAGEQAHRVVSEQPIFWSAMARCGRSASLTRRWSVASRWILPWPTRGLGEVSPGVEPRLQFWPSPDLLGVRPKEYPTSRFNVERVADG